MPSLVALDITPGQFFVDQMKKVWDNGDAILPIDQRLPVIAKQQLIIQLGASFVIDKQGDMSATSSGFAVEIGDALVVATSGSTGAPKGVVHTHDSILAAVVAGGNRIDCSDTDHWLSCLPLAHVGGLSVVLRALHYGSKLTIEPRAQGSTIANALNHGATLTSLVPTILQRIDISSFRAVLVGGSAMIDELPTNAITTYGLTESMGGIAYNGRALDGAEIRINNEQEIEIRGKMLFRNYRDGSDPKSIDGWFATADLGEIDSNSQLRVLGRKDDLIISGGHKVWPSTVERALMLHPNIGDVCVKGVPDPTWGNAVTAWIVRKDSTTNLSLSDVRDFLSDTLPDYSAPKKIYWLQEIPRNALGKVRVSDLAYE